MVFGGLLAWVLLVLVLGAACVWVVGGSGRATRGWWSVDLWSAGDAGGEGVAGDALVDGGVWMVGVGPRLSWRRFPWALLVGVLALVPLGVVDADVVVAGGVAVVAVVDAPG